MTIQQHSDNNLLIAEYTLGLLNPEETSVAQALLGQDAQAVITALKWEQALLELTDRLEPARLPGTLWQEVSDTLGFDDDAGAPLPLRPEQPTMTAVPPPPVEPPRAVPLPDTLQKTDKTTPEKTSPVDAAPKPERSGRWRVSLLQMAVLGGLVVVAVLAIGMIPTAPPPPEITVIEMAPKQAAILQAPNQSSTPGWVVTVTPEGNVLLNPRVRTDISADASVQLWTYSKSLPTPRSLGLIDPNQPVTVPAQLMGEISEGQFFEMTQETQGGSASAGPVGPILFIGQLVTFGQPTAPVEPPPSEAPL